MRRIVPATPYSIRFPSAFLMTLKDRHAETFAQHRLSFNAWILSQLGCTVSEQPYIEAQP